MLSNNFPNNNIFPFPKKNKSIHHGLMEYMNKCKLALEKILKLSNNHEELQYQNHIYLQMVKKFAIHIIPAVIS